MQHLLLTIANPVKCGQESPDESLTEEGAKMEQRLRQLQLVQLEMLKMVDSICRDNGISYSLYAGTLLGAVRHQGFIPWDDDLDICMPREDYNKFLALWEKLPHEGYLLQNKENTPRFTQSFTKIRKDHTTFLQEEGENEKYHTGIFIDIVPIDRIPKGKLARYRFWWDCMRYQLYTREFAPKQYGSVMRWATGLFLALTPRRKRKTIRMRLLQRITKNNEKASLERVGIETVESMRISFAADLLGHYTELTFEGSQFMCFAGWEYYLQRMYGDYTCLPPETERTWKHCPLAVNFERNYEERA